MAWPFDQARNVACISCKSVIEGAPVLLVTHFKDDDSWAFLDGEMLSLDHALVVAMSEVVDRHPELHLIASLPPGWTAKRAASDQVWITSQDS